MSFQPRLSPDGRWLAWGFGEVFLRDLDDPAGVVRSLGVGFQPVWIDERTVVASTDWDVLAHDVITRTTAQVHPVPLKDMDGGGWAWGGVDYPKQQYVTSLHETVPDCGVGAIYGSTLGVILGWGDVKPVIIDNVQVHPGPAVELRTAGGTLWVWRANGHVWQHAHLITRALHGTDLFWPVPVIDGDLAGWVLGHDSGDPDSRLYLRPLADETTAILVSDQGLTHHPHGVWHASRRQFVVSWWDGRAPQVRYVSTDQPRVSLLTSPIDPPVVDPPPVVIPPPVVVPPVNPMATIPALPGQLPIRTPFSYDTFIQNNPAEVDAYAKAYLDAHGREPAHKDLAQAYYRRLYEGYTHKAIIDGIWRGAGKVPPAVP